MSATALLWITLYCAAAVSSFVNPLYGALGYLLEYYMRPDLKWWGHDLPSLRYNLIISSVLGVSFILRRSSLREMVRLPNPALRCLLALAAVMLVVTPAFAVNPAVSADWMVQWFKMALVFPLLVIGVVRSRSAFEAFIAVDMLGAFWWGWDAWNNPHRVQSRLLAVGSGDTFNDNAASSHLLTVLPFIVIYLFAARDKRLRGIALLALPFVVNTIILCNSRGATLGVLAAGLASVYLVRSGYRLRLVGVMAAIVAAFFFLADSQFIERQQTTSNYEQDGSAQQRLISWQAGFRLVMDRPFGAGGRGFHLLSPRYIPEIVESHRGEQRAPHNTWVQAATDWGIAGFVCYVGAFGSAFVMLRRVKKASVDDHDRFYYWRALAIQLGLIGHLVSSTFTDRLYGEAGYWLVGLSYVLYRVQRTEEAERAKAATVPQAEARETASASWMPADAPAR